MIFHSEMLRGFLGLTHSQASDHCPRRSEVAEFRVSWQGGGSSGIPRKWKREFSSPVLSSVGDELGNFSAS